MFAICLVVIGILCRLIPHFWNFTPVIAVALFAGAYLSKRNALILPVALMILTDVIIGFHKTIFFTWSSMLIIAMLGFWLREQKSFSRVFSFSILSAVLFYLVTNLGAWYFYYPRTWQGLMDSYYLAIPFFRNSLVGTIIYSAILFGGYEFVALRVKGTKLAKAL